MTRQFCDRCDADISDKTSASLRIIDDADQQGNGTVTRTADLCKRCRSALATWLTANGATTNTRRRSGSARRRPGASASVTLPHRKSQVTR